jgi:hypothetical protein
MGESCHERTINGRIEMRLRLSPRKIISSCARRWEQRRVKRILSRYDFRGFKRIYHFHLRKTGGTSVGKMLMSCRGNDGNKVWTELGLAPEKPLISNGLIFVGWNQTLIDKGDYFFAFSHFSYDQLKLPPKTFTFTCFRDPAARLISHYKMLVDLSRLPRPHPCFAVEGKWLGDSFEDFLDRIPREHLQIQLFMFSNQFSVDEAVARVRKLNLWMFTEQFDDGVRRLSQATGLSMQSRHERKGQHVFHLRPETRQRLRQMLSEEYLFLERVQSLNESIKVRPSAA